ncbi:MAG TPA: GH116 family glycosyl hydrolase [Armatimonadota bacterium]
MSGRLNLWGRYLLAAVLALGMGTLLFMAATAEARDCGCADGSCNVSPLALTGPTPGVMPASTVPGPELWLQDLHALAAPALPKAAPAASTPVAQPRTYSAEHLGYVRMPIGGIGTGTLWLDGDGRVGAWQIANDYGENRIPGSLFAVRAQVAGQPAVTRLLQTVADLGLAPVPSLTFEGGYPIARLRYTDPALPVQMRLEAYNPMIPTDTANSSLPCAIFRFVARNEGKAPVTLQLLGTWPNTLANPGGAGLDLPDQAGAALLSGPGATGVAMSQGREPLKSGLVLLRGPEGVVALPDHLWVRRLIGPVELLGKSSQELTSISALAHIARDGGMAVVGGVSAEFFNYLEMAKQDKLTSNITVWEDFEKPTYEGWKVEGEAFGKGPASGAWGYQQPVSGFIGKGLVNTYGNGDGPQGRLSRDLTIEKRYLGFLLGGGAHPGETCLNLLVDGKVVRTATGRNEERLLPQVWDLGEFKGKTATIEILDHSSEGWGHINIDQITVADVDPAVALTMDEDIRGLCTAWTLPTDQAKDVTLGAGTTATRTTALPGMLPAWSPTAVVNLGAAGLPAGFTVLAATPQGAPLLVKGSFGKGTLILSLAPDLPWEWARTLLHDADQPATVQLTSSDPNFGTLAFTSPDAGTVAGTWADAAKLAGGFAATGTLTAEGPAAGARNGAVVETLTIPPGQERVATFVVTWHFPNVNRVGAHYGNFYSRRFADATAVAKYVDANAASLWEGTRLYHDTLYQSNLPADWLDAISSQSVIFRGPTCWWAEDGYFAGFEGAYGCCPLNCTHVWNYAQAHARLFPEIGRNMRRSDLLRYLHPSGETSHRQHDPTGAFADGQAATIEAAYREYCLSPDDKFLQEIYPAMKLAMDWMVERWDSDHDGVTTGGQPNTYDCNVSGANTFIGSQYLSALAAAEKMALVMGDKDAAGSWRKLREAGMKNQDERLWKDEYYIQIPDPQPANDYNTGCHTDQLLGQWWAHELGLGYLYPPDHVKTALQSVMKYNFRDKFAGFEQKPRRYIPDDEGGLLICTWPKGGRPDPFTIYSDEVWTGIEYAAAGAMIYEGMIDEASRVVSMARSRYDGVKRDGLNSGPGGDPFIELECGKFYARAMSSWGLLIAAQGQTLEGPAGVMGFAPNWQPENHRSFFTAPEGWGLFVQQRAARTQTDRLELRYGKLVLRELNLVAPASATGVKCTVKVGSRAIPATVQATGAQLRLKLAAPVTLAGGEALEASLRW